MSGPGVCSNCRRVAPVRNWLNVCRRCTVSDESPFDPPMSSKSFEDLDGIPHVLSDLDSPEPLE